MTGTSHSPLDERPIIEEGSPRGDASQGDETLFSGPTDSQGPWKRAENGSIEAAPLGVSGEAGETPNPLAGAHARVLLRPRKSKPFFGRHPWVLDAAIARVEPFEKSTVEAHVPDDVVDLISDAGKWIARGIMNRRSRISVRLYSWKPGERLDRAFWRDRLESAIQLRQSLDMLGPEKACRLVYSEADGVSGLIVDYYAGYLAIQPTAKAIADRLDLISDILRELLPVRGILLRPERTLVKQEGVALAASVLWGESPSGPIFIEENGLRWGVDLSVGQKTGFYLDQRDNRQAAARYARGRSVLDMFCYTGGFGLAAAKLGKAKEVLGVDASSAAIETAKANALLNHVHHTHFSCQDCFEAIDQLAAQGKTFGMVILDPPKFASDAAGVAKALSAYHRLNRQAVQILQPGGILVTCCCTGRITREDFVNTLSGVAQQSGRDIRLLEYRGAAADHPVSFTAREGEYLKCCICSVT